MRGPVIVSPAFKRFKDAAPVTFPVKLPVTLPVRFPVTFPVRLPATLPVTSPLKLAVTVPAEKFPDGSLLTRVPTVLAFVAAFATSSAECT